MPCYSPPVYFPADCEKTRKELDLTTRLACMFCGSLESKGKPIPDWAQEWWTKHRTHDDERRLQDADFAKESELRQQALAKLTKEELQALGLL